MCAISESMADPERIHEVISQVGRWHWAGVVALAAVAIGWRAFAGLAMGNAALGVGALAIMRTLGPASPIVRMKPAVARRNN
jgi:hypothetical protein